MDLATHLHRRRTKFAGAKRSCGRCCGRRLAAGAGS